MKPAIPTAIALLVPNLAWAQAVADASTAVNVTSIINTAIVGVTGVIGSVFLAWLQSHMKDKQAALVVSNAVKNSLGAIQQAGVNYVTSLSPEVHIPGVSPQLATGIQYVLNNAGPEAARLGITPEGIASKIDAQIGIAAIQTNIAVAGNATPVVPAPVGPVTVVDGNAMAAV